MSVQSFQKTTPPCWTLYKVLVKKKFLSNHGLRIGRLILLERLLIGRIDFFGFLNGVTSKDVLFTAWGIVRANNGYKDIQTQV